MVHRVQYLYPFPYHDQTLPQTQQMKPPPQPSKTNQNYQEAEVAAAGKD
jgi:hypothetical protein